MKVMDKHKNIINLLGVCTQDGECLTKLLQQSVIIVHLNKQLI